MSVPKPRGQVPKPDGQRRRTNTPASYGLAQPFQGGAAAPQPEKLGFPAKPLIVDMWTALGKSVEALFFSEADWERVRMELWFANKVMGQAKVSATAWAQVQTGLSELLISPADKRRVGIEMKRNAEDADETNAVAQIAAYQEKLAG